MRAGRQGRVAPPPPQAASDLLNYLSQAVLAALPTVGELRSGKQGQVAPPHPQAASDQYQGQIVVSEGSFRPGWPPPSL